MQLFYAVLTFVMAFNNLMKGLGSGNTMNYAMAVLWLTIGIVFTAKYIKDKKASKRKKEQNKEV